MRFILIMCLTLLSFSSALAIEQKSQEQQTRSQAQSSKQNIARCDGDFFNPAGRAREPH